MQTAEAKQVKLADVMILWIAMIAIQQLTNTRQLYLFLDF